MKLLKYIRSDNWDTPCNPNPKDMLHHVMQKLHLIKVSYTLVPLTLVKLSKFSKKIAFHP